MTNEQSSTPDPEEELLETRLKEIQESEPLTPVLKALMDACITWTLKKPLLWDDPRVQPWLNENREVNIRVLRKLQLILIYSRLGGNKFPNTPAV